MKRKEGPAGAGREDVTGILDRAEVLIKVAGFDGGLLAQARWQYERELNAETAETRKDAEEMRREAIGRAAGLLRLAADRLESTL